MINDQTTHINNYKAFTLLINYLIIVAQGSYRPFLTF